MGCIAMNKLTNRTSIKALVLALVVVLMTVGLSACPPHPSIFLQVDLNNSKSFNVDSVALKFRYGPYHGEAGHVSIRDYPSYYDALIDNFVLVCYALYFCDEQYYDRYNDFVGPYDDYYNINNQHFVKELSFKEFSSEKYAVKISFGNNRYKHKENLTVPKEVFERERGTFVLYIAEVSYSLSSDSYYVNALAYEEINYEYTGQQTVLLTHYQ